MGPMRTGWLIASATLLLAVATGCGDDAPETTAATASPSATSSEPSATTSDEPSDEPSDEATDESPSPSKAPAGMVACGTVWKDGAMLPRGFTACQVKGYEVKTEQRGCSFGQRLVIYDDHFYAVRGGTIHRTETPLKQDRGYKSAMASCTA